MYAVKHKKHTFFCMLRLNRLKTPSVSQWQRDCGCGIGNVETWVRAGHYYWRWWSGIMDLNG